MNLPAEPLAPTDNTPDLITAEELGALDTASGRRWRFRQVDEGTVGKIVAAAGVSSTLARIIASRGVDSDNVASFLQPSLRESLPDPDVLYDMSKASLRIVDAIQAGETVGVFGDYDVDGTSAAAILANYFKQIGAPLIVHLPDRVTEGYGPSAAAFESLKERGANLIVTVDCGAAADAPVAAAAKLGLDVVVIDHHLMDGPGPKEAHAIVNPHNSVDRSGLTNMSAAGLAFLVVVAINRRLREGGYFADRQEPDLRGLLDLAAVGLVCDVMSLTGLARIIVAQGLKVMSAGDSGPGSPGLRALAEAAGAKPPYSAYTLGFQVGPRINAAGRVGHAKDAFDLLTTDDPAVRTQLAEKLHVMNAARQEIEANVQRDAAALIEREGYHKKPVIVVAGEGWHTGVIGIVAGRLKEAYDRPTIVIGLENGVGKGSGRSLTGVDLGGAVKAACNEGLLMSGGGHEMAAGLTIAEDAVADFEHFLNERLQGSVARALQDRSRDLDAVVAANAVSRAFADDVSRAGPFGPGNPEPVFLLTDLAPVSTKPVGANHLAVTLLSGGETIRAIAFRCIGEKLGDILSTSDRVHVVGKIKADDWRGGNAAQLQIIDASAA